MYQKLVLFSGFIFSLLIHGGIYYWLSSDIQVISAKSAKQSSTIISLCIPAPKEVKKEIKPKLEKPKVVKDKDLTKTVKKARDVARKSGLLALQNDLSDLKSVVDVSTLKKNIAPRTERTIAAKADSLATSNILKRSSGIQTESLSAPVEQVKLAASVDARLTANDDEIALSRYRKKDFEELISKLNI